MRLEEEYEQGDNYILSYSGRFFSAIISEDLTVDENSIDSVSVSVWDKANDSALNFDTPTSFHNRTEAVQWLRDNVVPLERKMRLEKDQEDAARREQEAAEMKLSDALDAGVTVPFTRESPFKSATVKRHGKSIWGSHYFHVLFHFVSDSAKDQSVAWLSDEVEISDEGEVLVTARVSNHDQTASAKSHPQIDLRYGTDTRRPGLTAQFSTFESALSNVIKEAARFSGISHNDAPALDVSNLKPHQPSSAPSFSLQPISQISPFSKKDDKFRVGTSLRVVAKVPQPAPGTSNIDFENVPLEVLEKHMSQLDYAHLPADILEEQDARTKADKFVAWMRDNLLALHDAFPQDVRARATQWYDGANRIAKRLGKKWKYTPQQAAGVMAVLSPQKDWFKNVAQAEQVFDIWNTERDTVFTQQILDTAGEDIAQAAEAAPNELRKKKTKPGKKESKLARTRRMNYNRRLHEEAKQLRRDLFAPLKGKTIADLDSDPILQAWAIRMMAQYKFGGAYNALSPEGDQLGFVFTKSGSPAVNAWGSCNEIIKCVNILRDGSPKSISSQLGEEHNDGHARGGCGAPHAVLSQRSGSAAQSGRGGVQQAVGYFRHVPPVPQGVPGRRCPARIAAAANAEHHMGGRPTAVPSRRKVVAESG